LKYLCYLERNLERMILTGSLIVMAVVLIAQVIMRYFLRSPFVWSEELARYILVWCAVLGVSLAVRESRNISVDFLPTIFGPASIRFFSILAHLGVLAFSIVMVTASVPLIQRLAAIGQLSPALGIPMWMVYASVPVGFGLAAARTVQALVMEFRSPSVRDSEEGRI
jgi:TRAP-type C4-dicarboxylate transport system permease small subunit